MLTRKHPTEPLSLKANMLWNSAGSLVYFGFQWLLTVAVVRISGDYEAAGVLALAMAVYNIINPIAVYRMYTYQISDINRENSLGEYLAFRMLTTAVATILGVVYAFFTCPMNAVLPIALFMIYKMCTQHIDVLHATMQVNSRMDYIGKSNAMQGALSFTVFCLVFWLTRSLEITFVAMIFSVALIGVLYDLPRVKCFEPIELGISWDKARHLILYCLPIVVATIACSAVPSIPRQYLAMTQGESILGIYASVAAPAVIIQMGASYIYNPLISTFAQYHIKRDKASFTSLFVKTIAGIVVLGVVAGALLAFLGEWVLVLLFGASIAAYSYLLLPVIGCTFITALLWFFSDLLISMRLFRGVTIGNLIALVVATIVTPLLVNTFSANGVSFAIMIGFACGLIALSFFIASALRRDFEIPLTDNKL